MTRMQCHRAGATKIKRAANYGGLLLALVCLLMTAGTLTSGGYVYISEDPPPGYILDIVIELRNATIDLKGSTIEEREPIEKKLWTYLVVRADNVAICVGDLAHGLQPNYSCDCYKQGLARGSLLAFTLFDRQSPRLELARGERYVEEMRGPAGSLVLLRSPTSRHNRTFSCNLSLRLREFQDPSPKIVWQ